MTQQTLAQAKAIADADVRNNLTVVIASMDEMEKYNITPEELYAHRCALIEGRMQQIDTGTPLYTLYTLYALYTLYTLYTLYPYIPSISLYIPSIPLHTSYTHSTFSSIFLFVDTENKILMLDDERIICYNSAYLS